MRRAVVNTIRWAYSIVLQYGPIRHGRLEMMQAVGPPSPFKIVRSGGAAPWAILALLGALVWSIVGAIDSAPESVLAQFPRA